MKPSDQDMDDVLERLTESDDDIVFINLKQYPNRQYTRTQMAEQRTSHLRDMMRSYFVEGPLFPQVIVSARVLMPFTDADGHRWNLGDENK